MEKVKCGVSVSLDGFIAGNNMTLKQPFGDTFRNLLMNWRVKEPEKHRGEVDTLTAAGAFIIGANMF